MKSWQRLISIFLQWFANGQPPIRMYLIIGSAAIVVLALWFGMSGDRSLPIALFDSRELSPDEISLMQLAFGKAGLNQYEVANQTVTATRRSSRASGCWLWRTAL